MSAIERSVIGGNVNWDLKMTSDIQRCPFQSVHYIETLLCRFDRHFIRPQEKYLFREVSAIRRFYCGLLRFRRTLVFQMHSKVDVFSAQISLHSEWSVLFQTPSAMKTSCRKSSTHGKDIISITKGFCPKFNWEFSARRKIFVRLMGEIR